MKKSLFSLLGLATCLLTVSRAHAQPSDRPGVAPSAAETEGPSTKRRLSSIGLFPSFGEQSYSDVDLTLKLGLDPTWQLTGLGRRTEVEGITVGEERVGIDAKFSPAFSAHGSLLFTQDSVGLDSSGFAPGVAWTISELWHADLATILLFDLQFQHYTQSTTVTGHRRQMQAQTGVGQTEVTIGLTQEITDNISVTASYSKYNYSEDPMLLSQASSAHPALFSGIAGVVDGFPKNAFTLDGDWTFIENWTLNATYSRARQAIDDSIATSYGGGLTYDLNKSWSFSANVLKSKTLVTGTLWQYGVGATYYW